MVQFALNKGILLKGSNAIYFSNWIDFLFEFIPQLIFMLITFGYMNSLIVMKWLTDWAKEGTSNAPSLINYMLNLFLKLGNTVFIEFT